MILFCLVDILNVELFNGVVNEKNDSEIMFHRFSQFTFLSENLNEKRLFFFHRFFKFENP